MGVKERFRSDTGASAVELALGLVVLVYMLFGTIQFGIAYNRDQGLNAAAREGARIAAVGGSEVEVRDRVRQSQSLFTGTDVQVRIDYSLNDGGSWPGHQMICDDASGSKKCVNAAPSPCAVAGIGSLIRVTGTVPGGTGKYAIAIPLWGNYDLTFSASGVFRCEAT